MSESDIAWAKLRTAIETMTAATHSVILVVGEDQIRHGRLVALSDVMAAMNHIEAEARKHG